MSQFQPPPNTQYPPGYPPQQNSAYPPMYQQPPMPPQPIYQPPGLRPVRRGVKAASICCFCGAVALSMAGGPPVYFLGSLILIAAFILVFFI